MNLFHSIYLIAVGIICLSDFSEAKIVNLHPDLQSPPYVKDLQKEKTSAAQLFQILKNQELSEFYTAVNVAISGIRNIQQEKSSLSDIEKKNGLWLIHLIAQAPLFDLSQQDQLCFSRQSNNLDLTTKVNALQFLCLSKSYEFLEQDKESLALISAYYASILGDLIKYHRSYTPPASPLHLTDDLEKALITEVEKTMEQKSEQWKANRENIEDSNVEKEVQKWQSDLNQDIANVKSRYTDASNLRNRNYLRYSILSERIPRMEKRFIYMLVRNFPGKKGEVVKYIRMAGYKDDEINDLVDHTVGRDPKTEFLYKGRSKKDAR